MKIAMAAGEISGDLLAGSLVKALKDIDPEIQIAGLAGPDMEQQGCDKWIDIDQLSVMGLSEVLSQLPRLLRLRKKFEQRVLDWQPDVFVGIDAPDFNLPLEKKLSNKGVNTVHYVSPSVWAWRQKRVKKIKKSTRLMLTLFPFEQAFYQQHDVEAVFTGHPFADEIPLKIDRKQCQAALGLAGHPLIALLPGSRSQEINRIAPILLDTARLLATKYPQCHFIVPLPGQKQIQLFKQLIPDNFEVHITIIQGQSRNVLMAADVAVLASGTVALEAMLCKTPMVVGYQVSKVTYAIVKTFNMMLLPYYSLPNVLYGDFLVSEVLQDEMTAENLLNELKKLTETKNQLKYRNEFTRLHQDLLSPDNSAAKTVFEFLKQ